MNKIDTQSRSWKQQHENNNQRKCHRSLSKCLSEGEKRYAQTEKEALALIFDLITDHKLLEVIFGPKSRPYARIERWVLRLQ